MGKEVRDQWERFLTPKVLRYNLMVASLYITSFEVLKNSIIERIRDFFTTGFDEKGFIVDPKYQEEVLSKNKSSLYASLKWLKEMNAICDEDILIFEEIKKSRNKIAHDIYRMLMEGLPTDLPERFIEIVSLLDKIERWWIINVEIPTDIDLLEKHEGEEIDENGIISGTVVSLKIMVDIALGKDEEAEYYLKEFVNSEIISSDAK